MCGRLTRNIAQQALARHAAQRHLRDRAADRVRRHGRGLQGPRHPDRRRGRDQGDAARTRRERRRAGAVPQGSVGAAQPAPRGDRPLLRVHDRAGAAAALSRDGVRRRAVALRRPQATGRSTYEAVRSLLSASPPACRPRTSAASSIATSRPTTSSSPAATSRAPRSSISASRARRSSATARSSAAALPASTTMSRPSSSACSAAT